MQPGRVTEALGGGGEMLWQPGPGAHDEMSRFTTWVEQRTAQTFDSYDGLWEFSITERDRFWELLANYVGVEFHDHPSAVLAGTAMPDVEWFPGATLNYAKHALRGHDSQVVLEAISESRSRVTLTRHKLRTEVARVARLLAGLGVVRGDRVAAYLPNIPEAVIALLASASIGAVFVSCAPELRVGAVIERLHQVSPRVLFVVDAYRYGGSVVDRSHDLDELRRQLPSLEATIHVPYLMETEPIRPDAISWHTLEFEHAQPSGSEQVEFTAVPFEHPLYILFTSGTSGRPKAIVHGHGGVLIEHLKWLRLHADIRGGDRVLWPSNTSWMAWNASVSVLLCGATLIQWDGALGYPSMGAFWSEISSSGVTFLGTSPAFLKLCETSGVVPKSVADLGALRVILCGGAPLTDDGFRWVYKSINPKVYLQSASGGTEFCSAVVGGSPNLPVIAGRTACRMLGAHVEAFGDDGKPVIDIPGELVLRAPMPSMPVALWGDDATKTLLKSSYFQRFPDVWHHGDWVSLWQDGSCVVVGRSDATLNRGGVRMGTGEFYAVLEGRPEIVDSLVVHVDAGSTADDAIVVFVVLDNGYTLDAALTERLSDAVAERLSPRHRPDEIYAIDAIPRNAAGKKLEIPVKQIMCGTSLPSLTENRVTEPASIRAIVHIARQRIAHESKARSVTSSSGQAP